MINFGAKRLSLSNLHVGKHHDLALSRLQFAFLVIMTARPARRHCAGRAVNLGTLRRERRPARGHCVEKANSFGSAELAVVLQVGRNKFRNPRLLELRRLCIPQSIHAVDNRLCAPAKINLWKMSEKAVCRVGLLNESQFGGIQSISKRQLQVAQRAQWVSCRSRSCVK